MFVRYVLPVLAIGLLVFSVVYVMRARQTPHEVVAPIEPARNPFPATVAGSGMVEPQTENISIGSNVPGVVVSVSVQVGQKVREGDELFRLDDRHLRAELALKEAAVFAAQTQLIKLENEPRPERLPAAEAQVAEAEANVTDTADQLRRAEELRARNAISEEELNRRRQAHQMALSVLARHKSELELLKAGAWIYEKDIARAAIEEAKAAVEQVKTELDRLVVRALVDGEVLQVNVRPGEYVGTPPTQSLIVLGNVSQLHVRVDIDEHDIPRFKPGAPAQAVLRGEAKTKYNLRFVRVEPFVVPKKSLTGDNTERVDTRVLQVIYAIEPTEPMPYVGQRLDVFIDSEAEPEQRTEMARAVR